MTRPVSRRHLLKTGAASVAGVGAAVAIGTCDESGFPICRGSQAAAQPAAPAPASPASNAAAAAPSGTGMLFFFNDPEAAFVTAAVDRLIPPDATFAGAAAAGVLTYIDRQLASGFGAGDRMYLDGPWLADAPPEQGYQLRFTPAQLYQIGIEEIRAHVRAANAGREFWDLGEAERDDVLSGLETARIVLPSLPAPVFFETLLANTIEGFFADPAYGGNRDMVGWRMVGFPGAYAQYLELVDAYDYAYRREPISMANEDARHAHLTDHP
ncbi:gluconate 2-dehydrogenase subunit 3 family protein [Aquabacter spiritensis]|uniref:Gluconate 2-dehydrogenase gamma chain n=1 Tax=Aquabacter spiritensis TaxID=933073 RepID=A0A4R3LMG3_9HYPH|nr:gluconate 2-dehydrogenase subunit 3 family protein [Aquabacter spiritensis]TCT01560.1 gluconate 2-dehydrogenase gamma chain [Aquabacter spiritensis]